MSEFKPKKLPTVGKPPVSGMQDMMFVSCQNELN